MTTDCEALRILVVEDDRSTRALIRHRLERDGYVVEEAADGASGITQYKRTRPDVVLMDASMPEMDGFTACSKIRSLPGGDTTPVLVVTTLDDETSIAKAFESGATDYLGKPLHWPVLLHRLRRVIREERAQKRIAHLAHHDSLTGLPNRLLFLERLEQATTRVQRYNETFAVLNLDLDGFKRINDSMGHEAGDELLRRVGERLVHSVRKADTVARFGGDEFLLLIGMASEPRVEIVAQAILRELARPFRLHSGVASVTSSLGAVLCPPDGADARTLLTRADTAMYRAKRQGRNQFQFFRADIAPRTSATSSAATALRSALTQHDYSIQYRPIVDPISGRTVATQATVCWPQPELACLATSEILSLSEATRLTFTLFERVVSQVCADHATWQGPDELLVRSVITVSHHLLLETALVETLRQHLHDSSIPARAIELEISDGASSQDKAQYLPVLEELRTLGVALTVLDDATGRWSADFLRRSPVSGLKLASSLIGAIPSSDDDAAIVAATIQMALGLGLKVRAGGVSTEQQLAFLRDAACGEVQGNHVGPPVPAKEIARQLDSSNACIRLEERMHTSAY